MLWFKIVLTVYFGIELLHDIIINGEIEMDTLLYVFLLVGTWVWL